MRYHANAETGVVSECHAASDETCPFGSSLHGSTQREAEDRYSNYVSKDPAFSALGTLSKASAVLDDPRKTALINRGLEVQADLQILTSEKKKLEDELNSLPPGSPAFKKTMAAYVKFQQDVRRRLPALPEADIPAFIEREPKAAYSYYLESYISLQGLPRYSQEEIEQQRSKKEDYERRLEDAALRGGVEGKTPEERKAKLTNELFHALDEAYTKSWKYIEDDPFFFSYDVDSFKEFADKRDSLARELGFKTLGEKDEVKNLKEGLRLLDALEKVDSTSEETLNELSQKIGLLKSRDRVRKNLWNAKQLEVASRATRLQVERLSKGFPTLKRRKALRATRTHLDFLESSVLGEEAKEHGTEELKRLVESRLKELDKKKDN